MLTSFDSLFTGISNFLEARFDLFDGMAFIFNLLIFLFSRKVVGFLYSPNSDQDGQMALKNLRAINLILFASYFIPLYITENEPSIAGKISSTAYILLGSFFLLHIVNYIILQRMGQQKVIDGETIHSETYQSEMFGLLALVGLIIAVFLAIINIWNLTDWLKATSVFGGLLIIAFSTKDVWAPDNINGLILLYNGDIEPGSVVRVQEFDLLAVVQKVTLTQTLFRDLRFRNMITLPNSKFRTAKIEILSNATGKGLVQFTDFKLGYGLSSEQVETFLCQIWEKASKAESAINETAKPKVTLVDNGDHAVTWRLYYTVGNVYKLLGASFAINKAAYDLSLETGIGLNTPITHDILSLPLEKIKADLPEPD